MRKATLLLCILPLPVCLLFGCGGGGGGAAAPATMVTKSVQGTILNVSGSPLAGATVTVVGTRALGRADSTTTGADGRFGLWVRVTTTSRTILLQVSGQGLTASQFSVDLGPDEVVETALMVAPNTTPNGQNTPPTISGVTTSPPLVDFTGGVVTISAQVTDPDNAEVAVAAVVVGPDQTTIIMLLTPAGAGTYTGTFTAPANFGANATDDRYHVVVCANDAPNGSNVPRTAGAVRFTVRANAAPPDMPPSL